MKTIVWIMATLLMAGSMALGGSNFDVSHSHAIGQTGLAETKMDLLARANPGLPPPVESDILAESLEELLERRIDQGDALVALGNYGEALPNYHEATELAKLIESVDDLIYTRQRLGHANWGIFKQTGHPGYARVALLYWEIEADLYRTHGYPAVFGALVAYDLGRAHAVLATYEDPESHMQAAAIAFQDMSQGLTDGERALVMQLSSGYRGRYH